MASEDKETPPEAGVGTSRHTSPPPGLRHRPLSRAATFAEPSMPLNRRRSSIFSEGFSDARKSLRSSTDDLLFPKVTSPHRYEDGEESSPWHSLPLGLALLPAVGGMVFKDGSAVITDITILALAAIFMNWALRMPWEWYHASQTLSPSEPGLPSAFSPIEEEEEDELNRPKSPLHSVRSRSPLEQSKNFTKSEATLKAQQELRLHEFLALVSCFVFPMLAAWLLHAIRSQLSRPSEGLVSNYNLTIFLLVAEIRPLSHFIKMVQKRTLFLQRTVNFDVLQDSTKSPQIRLEDLQNRVDELEAHVADGIASAEKPETVDNAEVVVAKATSQATSELRRVVQPELDALNRAMRRYEKRATVSVVQQEARMQELEARVKDVVVLAAAVQRHADQQPRNYVLILTNWLCALVVIPLEQFKALLMLPHRVVSSALVLPKRYLSSIGPSRRVKEVKGPRKQLKSQTQDREKKDSRQVV